MLLHFNQLGYTPVQLAFLFLLYEFFGIVTNLVGGWLAARTGLRFTLVLGLALQVVALGLLAFLNREWSMALSVAYVMGCQALSGIAKDLTKMSAKSAVKVLVPEGRRVRAVQVGRGADRLEERAERRGLLRRRASCSRCSASAARLRRWPTGVLVVLVFVLASLPAAIGQAKKKPTFTGILSNSPGINVCRWRGSRCSRRVTSGSSSACRFFWRACSAGRSPRSAAFMALWVIAYGGVQSAVAGAAVAA